MAAEDVRFDDFVDIGFGDVPVPHSFGIDDEVGAVFALIETARLVRSYFALQAAFREFLLEQFLQFGLAAGIAASPEVSRRALVAADENMLFEFGHEIAEFEFDKLMTLRAVLPEVASS
jgi:hypothetical protein